MQRGRLRTSDAELQAQRLLRTDSKLTVPKFMNRRMTAIQCRPPFLGWLAADTDAAIPCGRLLMKMFMPSRCAIIPHSDRASIREHPRK
jgi:hypothetical protein